MLDPGPQRMPRVRLQRARSPVAGEPAAALDRGEVGGHFAEAVAALEQRKRPLHPTADAPRAGTDPLVAGVDPLAQLEGVRAAAVADRRERLWPGRERSCRTGASRLAVAEGARCSSSARSSSTPKKPGGGIEPSSGYRLRVESAGDVREWAKRAKRAAAVCPRRQLGGDEMLSRRPARPRWAGAPASGCGPGWTRPVAAGSSSLRLAEPASAT